jgi:hypothetical protein
MVNFGMGLPLWQAAGGAWSTAFCQKQLAALGSLERSSYTGCRSGPMYACAQAPPLPMVSRLFFGTSAPQSVSCSSSS